MPSNRGFGDFLTNTFAGELFKVVLDAWFLWLPISLFLLLRYLYLYYIRAKYIYKIDWALLEIRIPKEIFKGPQAAEIFLSNLHQTSEGNFLDKFVEGKQRSWFSLEIVGIGGNVHFYIYAPKGFRNIIESQVYAQYPDVEITEVDDYAKIVNVGDFWHEWDVAGAEFILANDNYLPIKTYVDFGLDKTITKEEQKSDPLTALIEAMGILKPGHQAWMQILIRASKKDLKDDVKKKIDELLGRDKKTEDGKPAPKPTISATEKDIIEGINNKMKKLQFEVGIRYAYVAPKKSFDKGMGPTILTSITKPYAISHLNSLKPVNGTSVDYPPFKSQRVMIKKRNIITAYKNRGYFYDPFTRVASVMNVEELATLFHIPGRVAETPTFERIDAKKSEPPANLPI